MEITTEKDYIKYCNKLERLGELKQANKKTKDEIIVLEKALEKYNETHFASFIN